MVIAAIHIEGAAWNHVASSFLQRLPTVELVWRDTLDLNGNTDINGEMLDWPKKRGSSRRGSRILKWGVNFCNNVREIKYYFNI